MNKYAVELVGSFFLFLTVGVAAVLGTAGPSAPLAVGAALMVMVYAGRHLSGAHYNPAVTVAVFIRGRCAGREVAPYIGAQLLGAAVAAFLVLRIFGPAVLEAGESIPAHDVDKVGAGAIVAAELLFAFALAYVFLNVTTSQRTEGNSYYGLAIGFTLVAGSLAVGSLTPGAFNPAVSTALCLIGAWNWADLWMHFLPQFLGAVLAAFTFKGLNPEDR